MRFDRQRCNCRKGQSAGEILDNLCKDLTEKRAKERLSPSEKLGQIPMGIGFTESNKIK